MHPTTRIRNAAVAAFLAAGLVGCSGSSAPDTSGTQVDQVDYASVQREPTPTISRAEQFQSVEQLESSSDLVVIATGTGDLVEDENADQYTPLGNVTVAVKEVLSGGSYRQGDSVLVFVEAARNDDGTLRQDKIRPNVTYLLYLSRLRPGSEVYAITGYLAGQFEEVAPNHYGRVDAESPALPLGLDLSNGEMREIYAD